MRWHLKRRWTAAGDLGWPPLVAPQAAQASHGSVTVGDAVLTSPHGHLWLAALDAPQRYIVGYLGLQPTTLPLTTPQGSSTINVADATVLLWQAGRFAAV